MQDDRGYDAEDAAHIKVNLLFLQAGKRIVAAGGVLEWSDVVNAVESLAVAGIQLRQPNGAQSLIAPVSRLFFEIRSDDKVLLV